MKKYFEIEQLTCLENQDWYVGVCMNYPFSFEDGREIPRFKEALEIPDPGDREKLLENAKELMHGWIAGKPNTRCTHDWLTRYAALKKEGK